MSELQLPNAAFFIPIEKLMILFYKVIKGKKLYTTEMFKYMFPLFKVVPIGCCLTAFNFQMGFHIQLILTTENLFDNKNS